MKALKTISAVLLSVAVILSFAACHKDVYKRQEEDDAVKVAVIGKPNAGKSSLVNRIAGEQRSIVSDIAGTTRDTVDSRIENKFGKFVFIDTAGLRRKSRVAKAGDDIERYSIIRAEMAVDRADAVSYTHLKTGIKMHLFFSDLMADPQLFICIVSHFFLNASIFLR